MADRRRLVTMSAGGRPVLELDLEVTDAYHAVQGTFAYAPGQQNPMASREPGRFGGQVVVGEQNDNGTASWQALVKGSTEDQAAANIEALLGVANRSSQGRLLEWRPDGSSFSSYFRVAGPGAWRPMYKWAQWEGAQSMVVEVSFPVRPLVLWDPMTIVDPFDVDSLVADYTADAGLANTAVSGGAVTASGTLTAERRVRHTVRGYPLLEGQATVRTSPGATIAGYKAGVLLRASAADTYVEVYVDDNGTNSRLRIDVVIGGTRTNRASTNLAARINSPDSKFWVRGRIEGGTVVAEYLNNLSFFDLSPMVAPTLTNNYTLSGGEQSSLVAGFSGWSWVPQDASATLDEFEFRPFTYRNVTLPEILEPTDQVPGTASALADVNVTPSGGSAGPVWAMVAWAKEPNPSGLTPLTILEAESLSLSAWASSAQAGARGGEDVRATTSGASSAYGVEFNVVDLVGIEADEFAAQIDVEVWARVLLSSTLVNPRIILSAGAYATTLVDRRYSVEYGTAGKLLAKPSSGTVYRFVRLGTVTLDATSETNARFVLNGSVEAGSSGVFGVDYVVLAPVRRRAAGMTGVALAAVNPFVPNTGEWTKRIRSDLSATLRQEQSGAGPGGSYGLGGALIQPSPGRNRWLVKLSSLVPDDPTSNASSEQLAHSATVSLDVTPRSYMLRGA